MGLCIVSVWLGLGQETANGQTVLTLFLAR